MHLRMIVRSIILAFATAVLVLSLGAGTAFAGEITGNGKSLKNEDGTLNGKSACAFSGLNDTYTGDPNEPDEDGFTRTQNWGQLDKETKEFLTSIGVHPGTACRGNVEHSEPEE